MKNFLTFILLTISTASIGQNTQVETIRQNPQYKSQTFSSTTKGYFIKVELQFSDTTLIGFTLTGNCKKSATSLLVGKQNKLEKPKMSLYLMETISSQQSTLMIVRNTLSFLKFRAAIIRELD